MTTEATRTPRRPFYLSPLTRSLARWALILTLAASACSPVPATPAPAPQILRLATTTSTDDSGLLDYLLPDFEAQHNVRVDVIAVGSGQALALGANGDADVLLVHARSLEEKFVAEGHGIERREVMFNDFVVVGPAEDPAGIAGAHEAGDAFARVASRGAPFVSRGDDSGTHAKEKALWTRAGIEPSGSNWYLAVGQGMGETLLLAEEKRAYTLADRATWLALRDRLPGLTLLVGGDSLDKNPDPELLNPYGVIPVNPQKHPGVNHVLAVQFADWITSLDTQRRIGEFGRDQFGQPLFYPDSAIWRAANH